MFFQEIFVFVKDHIILIVVWFLLLILVVYNLIISWVRGFFEISCDKAILLINKRNALVLDVRSQDEYYSGYIINSINILFEDMKKNHGFLDKKCRSNPLIIVCGSSNQSCYLVRKYLDRLGFLEIYVLQGGIYNWKSNNLPLLLKNKI